MTPTTLAPDRMCMALDAATRATTAIQRQRFEYLPNGRQIIKGWFQRALPSVNRPDPECFEPFIFCWIAFNAWGESVTGQDRDQEWMLTVARDPALKEAFARLVANPTDPLARPLEGFKQYWPIPKVQDWRRRTSERPADDSSQGRLEFFERHHIAYEPHCASRHGRTSSIPGDWEHFLRATYRVRCNLFHGEKGLHDPHDQVIVASAFRVLAQFLDTQGIFGGGFPT